MLYTRLVALAVLRRRLAEYEDTGLTPEQIKEIDRLYSEQAKELGEYKKAEEQGLLLRLPCKVGDTLYIISNNEIEECVVKEMIYRAYRLQRIEIYFENSNGFESCLFNGELNEGVFLTYEKAEAALQKNEGGKYEDN